MLRRLLPVVPFALCAALALAAGDDEGGMRDSSSVVTVSVSPDTVRADVGDPVEVAVTLEIAKGWHLYAHGDTQYYGIGVTGLDSVPLAAVAVDYPAGHPGTFLGDRITLLAGSERLAVRGYLAAAPEKPLTLEVELQACDDRSCLAPAWLPFTFAVEPKE